MTEKGMRSPGGRSNVLSRHFGRNKARLRGEEPTFRTCDSRPRYHARMKDFILHHQSKIKGVLSCFDRMLFRGYLSLQYSQGMAGFLRQRGIPFGRLKPFLLETSGALKAHAQRMAEERGRPYRYLDKSLPMEQEARAMAERDAIEEGLVCVFARLELSRTYSFSFRRLPPSVHSDRRKCLHLYYYFMDREFGLIPLKLQTWFPSTMQVYVNVQEWLSRKLRAHGIKFTKLDNVLVDVEDFERAQAFADRLSSLPWPRILDRWTRQINPLMRSLLRGSHYYWVASQMEYATDVIFKSRSALAELYPRLLRHGMLCCGAKDVMGFLGKKLRSNFQGEVTTDLLELTSLRTPGARIKHRVKENWLKMYDKAGLVLRAETVINNPGEFRVRRRVRRKGKQTMAWTRMLKGLAYLFRYRDVSRSANSRYLDALAVVSDPTAKVREVERITSPKRVTSHRTAMAFNPLSQDDCELFAAFMNGQHSLGGFKNGDIRRQLAGTAHMRRVGPDERRRSAKSLASSSASMPMASSRRYPAPENGEPPASGAGSWPHLFRSRSSHSRNCLPFRPEDVLAE